VLAQFSKLKIVQAPNFREFRKVFRAKPGQSFIVPANTFDNVKGQFPIGFFIWHTDQIMELEDMYVDIYDANGLFQGTKTISTYLHDTNVIEWLYRG
jgi:fluoride ion exporter CrcB/FEX